MRCSVSLVLFFAMGLCSASAQWTVGVEAGWDVTRQRALGGLTLGWSLGEGLAAELSYQLEMQRELYYVDSGIVWTLSSLQLGAGAGMTSDDPQVFAAGVPSVYGLVGAALPLSSTTVVSVRLTFRRLLIPPELSEIVPPFLQVTGRVMFRL